MIIKALLVLTIAVILWSSIVAKKKGDMQSAIFYMLFTIALLLALQMRV